MFTICKVKKNSGGGQSKLPGKGEPYQGFPEKFLRCNIVEQYFSTIIGLSKQKLLY